VKVNPDFNYNKTTASTTWTLKHPDGHVVTFKVVKNGNVIITNEDKHSFGCIVEKARKYWGEYINRGFVVYNKCVDHDMKEFHSEIENVYYIPTDKISRNLISKPSYYSHTSKRNIDREKYALVDHKNSWKEYKKMLKKTNE